MSDNAMLIPEKIFFKSFHLVKGELDSPFGFENEKINDYSIQADFDMGFDHEKKAIKADFKIEVITESNGENIGEARGMFHLVFIFYVENLNDLITIGENQGVEVHADLGNAISSITYSTSRGILMTRFQGTVLENFILPVINPNNLLKK